MDRSLAFKRRPSMGQNLFRQRGSSIPMMAGFLLMRLIVAVAFGAVVGVVVTFGAALVGAGWSWIPFLIAGGLVAAVSFVAMVVHMALIVVEKIRDQRVSGASFPIEGGIFLGLEEFYGEW